SNRPPRVSTNHAETLDPPAPALPRSCSEPHGDGRMERAHRGWRLAALLGLGISLTAPVAAQQQAESPYLDIQWNSQVVRLMLPVPAGLCQADAKPDAAPIWSEYDSGNEWPHTLKPSMMRAMFYLA